jgi:hypothetical protein
MRQDFKGFFSKKKRIEEVIRSGQLNMAKALKIINR